jgi:hypothetical protein
VISSQGGSSASIGSNIRLTGLSALGGLVRV